MRKKLIIGLLSGLFALQIALPVLMIVKRELTLKEGAIFRFKTAPVDPYDAFRGRYVAIRAVVNKVNKPEGLNLKHGQKVYAHLIADEKGFAQVSRIAARKPEDSAFMIASVVSLSSYDVGIDLPIDRYYMEERAAPLAEKFYRARGNQQDAYVTVRVKNGFAVIEGLYVGDQKIEDFVKQNHEH